MLARDGVHGVPLQQISTEAGVSKGLLIYRFQTKDGLVLASLEWVLESTEARIREHSPNIRRSCHGHLQSGGYGVDWPGGRLRLLPVLSRRGRARGSIARVRRIRRSGEVDPEPSIKEVIVAGLDAGVLEVEDPTVAAIQMQAVIEGTFSSGSRPATGGPTTGVQGALPPGLPSASSRSIALTQSTTFSAANRNPNGSSGSRSPSLRAQGVGSLPRSCSIRRHACQQHPHWTQPHDTVARGDAEAFSELYDQTSSLVYGLKALRVVRSEAMAEG